MTTNLHGIGGAQKKAAILSQTLGSIASPETVEVKGLGTCDKNIPELPESYGRDTVADSVSHTEDHMAHQSLLNRGAHIKNRKSDSASECEWCKIG